MHISRIIQVYYGSVTNDTLTNRHEFGRDRAFNFAFNFATSCKLHSIFWHSIFLLDFCIQFLRTWTRPGVYLVVYLVSNLVSPGRKKTFNFEGTKTFNLWNGGLTGDSEGSKSQKNIQFLADPGVYQVLSWSCPGVSLVFPWSFQAKKGELGSLFWFPLGIRRAYLFLVCLSLNFLNFFN